MAVVLELHLEAPLVERLHHAGAHLVQVERLGDVVERAELQAGDGAVDLGHGRDHDDGGIGPPGDDLAQQPHPIHLGHPQVGDDEGHLLVVQHLHRLRARPRFGAREAFALEQPHQDAAQTRLVIDHQALDGIRLGHRRRNVVVACSARKAPLRSRHDRDLARRPGGAFCHPRRARREDRRPPRVGLECSFVDASDTRSVAAAVTPRTKMIYAETPTNPMMRLCDLAAAGEVARRASALFVVDNTFATPYFQQPLELGADIVLHSTTKYLNGHSDMVGGMLVTNSGALAERLGVIQNASGAGPGPFDCWLALRGPQNPPLRMRQPDANARRIAEWLAKHPKVERVYYPGLPSHPQHELACRQMKGFGGMISLELGSLERAKRFAERTRIFALAESLGGVESLIGHPASMTHASVPADMRRALGLTDSLVRLSVGIEDVDDLIADLEQALDAA